mmetsp:Transcript_13567/g.41023  ORF Transcript_13567/g.41023 Transcript_13567/m.41023 type:complete len:290 (+) Transcript_13567:190-1059(+)
MQAKQTAGAQRQYLQGEPIPALETTSSPAQDEDRPNSGSYRPAAAMRSPSERAAEGPAPMDIVSPPARPTHNAALEHPLPADDSPSQPAPIPPADVISQPRSYSSSPYLQATSPPPLPSAEPPMPSEPYSESRAQSLTGGEGGLLTAAVPADHKKRTAPSVALRQALDGRMKRAKVGMPMIGKKKSIKAQGAASLISRWQAVKQDAGAASDDEYASDGIARAEATFKTRDREAEDWRLRQLQSGQAADNPNFQPLLGDWRDKVKAIKKEEKRRKLAVKAAAAMKGSTAD